MTEDGRLVRAILAANSRYTPKRNRMHWYVDGDIGVDANAFEQGRIPDRPLATIGYALTIAAAGDCIHIAEGTYDETISVPAGLNGLEVICEPGVFLSNTTPGTVLTIAAPYMRWTGGIISQAGQVGLLLTGIDFTGIDMVVNAAAIAYDIGANRPKFYNCIAENYTQSGFETVSASGIFKECSAHGQAAARGFYLSGAGADSNLFIYCSSINNTAAGYETVAGADENVFFECYQGELCGGPVDAGANNTWIWKEESQIAVGNSLQQDIADVHTIVGAGLNVMDFWSDPQEEVAVTAAPGTLALPDVVVADVPGEVVRAIALIKFRMVENTNVGNPNSLDGATVAGTSQVIQVRDDTPGTWRDAIDFVDDQFTLAADTRESGDVCVGSIDIAVEVDGDDTYNFQWLLSLANQNNLQLNDVQTGIRLWCRVV